MNRFKLYAFLCVVICVSSCKETSNTRKGEKVISYDSLSVDTIQLGQLENTSYVGFSGICEDSLYFFDSVLCYYYKVGTDGTIGNKKMGLGHGPGEIPTRVEGVSYSPETKLLFAAGSTYDGYTYDERTNSVKRLNMKAPNWEDPFRSPGSYSTWDEYIQVSYKNNVFFNILNEEKQFMLSEENMEKSAIIMKYDTETGDMTTLGNFSKFMLENQNRVRHLPHIYFDVALDGTFYVTFQADASIYHFDEDFNPIANFGFEGRDMDTDYSESTTGVESFGKAYEADMNKVGFYTWLKHVNDYTFRSYRKSGTAERDGLQIYDKKYNLIADLDVPRGLKVTGYIAPYYVSQIVSDEDNQTLSFYRFKIDE